MMRISGIAVPATALLLLVAGVPGPSPAAPAGWFAGRTAAEKEGGGMNVDLSVRRVTVSPVRARVGDTIRVEVLVENRDEGRDTTSAVVYANGKAVARRLFSWGDSPGERLHRLSFEWDTKGEAPGEYRITAEAFVWADSSPFDNRLEVAEPVLLVAPGGTFPDGAKAGGSATETDPRFGGSRFGR